MSYVNGLTEEGFIAGVTILPKLTCLMYYSKEELQLETFSAICRACPRISTFTTRFTSEEAVLHYAHCFPQLTSLCHYSFHTAESGRSVLSLSGYFEVLRVCPRIMQLDMPRALPLDDVEAILRGHKQLTTLTVDVYSSGRVGTRTNCPALPAVATPHCLVLLYISGGDGGARWPALGCRNCMSVLTFAVVQPLRHYDCGGSGRLCREVYRAAQCATVFPQSPAGCSFAEVGVPVGTAAVHYCAEILFLEVCSLYVMPPVCMKL